MVGVWRGCDVRHEFCTLQELGQARGADEFADSAAKLDSAAELACYMHRGLYACLFSGAVSCEPCAWFDTPQDTDADIDTDTDTQDPAAEISYYRHSQYHNNLVFNAYTNQHLTKLSTKITLRFIKLFPTASLAIPIQYFFANQAIPKPRQWTNRVPIPRFLLAAEALSEVT